MDEEVKTTETTAEDTTVTEEKPKKKKTASAAEVKELKAKLDEQEDAYKRMLAEYSNYKRRTEQEKENIGLFTKGELLKELLPVLDNFERAAVAPAGEEYKTGMEMIIRQFEKTLADMGLLEIEAENAPFDPELHNAVMREDAEDVETETVTQVFQKGYRLGDRVLRPAMVKVAN